MNSSSDLPLSSVSDSMPDVASHGISDTHAKGALDWVGMSEIELPITIDSISTPYTTKARVQAYVNLSNEQAKGIHMSRLYLLLDQWVQTQRLSITSVAALLKSFVSSHQGLSEQAFVQFKFDYFIRQPSLISDYSGFKSYPITITSSWKQEHYEFELYCEVPYSSTCPCSAALARQLIQQQFDTDFQNTKHIDKNTLRQWLGSAQGIVATPHSQRSIAQVRTKLALPQTQFPIEELIGHVETALKTPVQAAVKREDEQEFARLNGQNPMFCEDAGRILKNHLNTVSTYQDYWIRVNHIESLHPHDAVSIVTKGVKDGYLPIP